jgi:hypothetical protein
MKTKNLKIRRMILPRFEDLMVMTPMGTNHLRRPTNSMTMPSMSYINSDYVVIKGGEMKENKVTGKR